MPQANSTNGIGQHLAVFGRDDGGQLVLVPLQQFLEFEHHACTAQRRRG
jgi:hypothetical protein